MKKFLMAGVAVLGLTFQSYGAMLGQGTKEFHVGGRIDSDDDVNIMLQGGVGYFVIEAVEVGVNGDVSYTGSDDSDPTQLGVSVFGEYNYDGGTDMIPYAGGTVGFKYFEAYQQSDVPFEVSVYAGAKFYLMETLSLGTQLQVWVATDPIYQGDHELSKTDWAIVMRTQFYF